MNRTHYDRNQPQATPASPSDSGPLEPISIPSSSSNTPPVFGSPVTGGAPAAKRPWPAATLLGDLVGKLLGVVARYLSPSFVERSLVFARDTGHYAVLAGGALTVLYAIFAAIKYNSFALFVSGLGFVAALAVAQFTATRFLNAAESTIASTPSRIGSPAFLECTGLLVLLFAVATLLGGIVTAIQVGSIVPLLPALFTAAVLTYFSATALHSGIVNIETGAGTAGEEAIGLLSFFFKASLKLVPLFFFLFAVAGGLAIIASFFQAGQGFASVVGSILQTLPLPVDVPYGLVGSAVVLLACILPLVAYFVFLLQYLFLDVLRAVLCVPAKLDALKH